MKKYIFLALFLALVLVTPVLAQTSTTELIAQLQAQIAQLTATLNQLLAQQNQGGFCYNFDRDIQQGEHTMDGNVTYLHQVLMREGFSLGQDAAGEIQWFSQDTLNAVKQFQSKYGLPATGYVGKLTRAKLNELYGCNKKVFITPESLPVGKVSAQSIYAVRLISHGFADPDKVSWSVASGALPAGLSLENTCLPEVCPPQSETTIKGWPTTAGTYTFTVQATNGTQTATKTYTLVVKGKDNSGAPIISSVSGPTSLKVGETGTWTIKASDPNGGSLAYSVSWGDEANLAAGTAPVSAPAFALRQTASFQHAYSKPGSYLATFTVMNEKLQKTQSQISVAVTGSNQSPITVLSPNGGESWVAGTTGDIKWTYANTNTRQPALVDIYLDGINNCIVGPNMGVCPAWAMAPIVLDKNIKTTGNTTYHWLVASEINSNDITIPAGEYRVRVCAAGSQTNCDASDAPFTIDRGDPTIVP